MMVFNKKASKLFVTIIAAIAQVEGNGAGKTEGSERSDCRSRQQSNKLRGKFGTGSK
jgi:hypothetical protein